MKSVSMERGKLFETLAYCWMSLHELWFWFSLSFMIQQLLSVFYFFINIDVSNSYSAAVEEGNTNSLYVYIHVLHIFFMILVRKKYFDALFSYDILNNFPLSSLLCIFFLRYFVSILFTMLEGTLLSHLFVFISSNVWQKFVSLWASSILGNRSEVNLSWLCGWFFLEEIWYSKF